MINLINRKFTVKSTFLCRESALLQINDVKKDKERIINTWVLQKPKMICVEKIFFLKFMNYYEFLQKKQSVCLWKILVNFGQFYKLFQATKLCQSQATQSTYTLIPQIMETSGPRIQSVLTRLSWPTSPQQARTKS